MLECLKVCFSSFTSHIFFLEFEANPDDNESEAQERRKKLQMWKNEEIKKFNQETQESMIAFLDF